MKDLSYYQNIDLEYPSPLDYMKYSLFKDNQFITNDIRTIESILKYIPKPSKVPILTDDGYLFLSILDKDKFNNAKSEYHKAENVKYNEFKHDLIEENGLQDNPKADLLYEKAWSLGHSSGLQEVIYYFKELMELIV